MTMYTVKDVLPRTPSWLMDYASHQTEETNAVQQKLNIVNSAENSTEEMVKWISDVLNVKTVGSRIEKEMVNVYNHQELIVM